MLEATFDASPAVIDAAATALNSATIRVSGPQAALLVAGVAIGICAAAFLVYHTRSAFGWANGENAAPELIGEADELPLAA